MSKIRDEQRAIPLRMFAGTKASIEARTGLLGGEMAYATPDGAIPGQIGFYNGSIWKWTPDFGGIGDMLKITYDVNDDGVVDNAAALAGHAAAYFATADHTHSNLGAGDMLKTTYDTDDDGAVNNSEALDGHSAAYFATADHVHEAIGTGDMAKAVYDTDNNGVVDDADGLEGHPASYFAAADHTHPSSELTSHMVGVLTNGNPDDPQIIFAGGDIVAIWEML